MYTVNEAAKKLNLDPSQIRRLLRSGELDGRKWGRDWTVFRLNYRRKRRLKGGTVK
ncbi:MAG: helix-turn-helix domain-containing protein [Dehalococcoidia bacterium]|nr:MAG: helix-turn-helix domain-containing protein [Dehalococcoidia bacterium]